MSGMSRKSNKKELEKKPICINLINGKCLNLNYDKTTLLQTIFETTCNYANLTETDFFGLSIFMDDFYHFLDLQSKVSKINFQMIHKKTGFFKSSSEVDLSATGETPMVPTVYLRVQYYVRWNTLRDRATRLFYFHQMKANLLLYKLVCADEVYFQLAALALQAEYGNYSEALSSRTEYFDPKLYFPRWLVSRYGITYLLQHVPSLHRTHQGMGRHEATNQFIRTASKFPSNFNMHLCRLLEHAPFERKTETPIWMGLSPDGIELHQERSGGFVAYLNTITWAQISKLSFKKRRLQVYLMAGRTVTLEAASSLQAQHIFWLCEKMHMFQTAAQLAATASPEASEDLEQRRFRESYVYSDQNDLDTQLRHADKRSSSSSLPRSANRLSYQPVKNRDSYSMVPDNPTSFNSLPHRTNHTTHKLLAHSDGLVQATNGQRVPKIANGKPPQLDLVSSGNVTSSRNSCPVSVAQRIGSIDVDVFESKEDGITDDFYRVSIPSESGSRTSSSLHDSFCVLRHNSHTSRHEYLVNATSPQSQTHTQLHSSLANPPVVSPLISPPDAFKDSHAHRRPRDINDNNTIFQPSSFRQSDNSVLQSPSSGVGSHGFESPGTNDEGSVLRHQIDLSKLESRSYLSNGQNCDALLPVANSTGLKSWRSEMQHIDRVGLYNSEDGDSAQGGSTPRDIDARDSFKYILPFDPTKVFLSSGFLKKRDRLLTESERQSRGNSKSWSNLTQLFKGVHLADRFDGMQQESFT